MTVLVTGATGFLGRHLLPLLQARGEPVRALVRAATDDAELRAAGVEVARGDVLDAEAVRRAADGCGLVLHLAGLVSHRRSDRARLFRTNVGGVTTVLAAADPAARILCVTSVAAIGPVDSPEQRADETWPFPRRAHAYPYAASKRAAEDAALGAARAGRDVVVACPGFLLGPGDVYAVSTWPVREYLRGRLRVTTRGGLSNVDARDVAAGLVALAERGRRGERYALTAREGNLPHAELFRRLGAAAGVRRRTMHLPPALARAGATLVRRPVHPDEIRAAANWWFFDPGKAERELGFATRPLDETLAETAAQYRR